MPDEREASPPSREHAIALLAPHFSLEQLTSCLDYVMRVDIPLTKVFGLVSLVPHLPGRLREQALQSARTVTNKIGETDEFSFPLALAALIPVLPDVEKEAAVDDLLPRLRLGWVGNEEALASVIPLLRREAFDPVLRWVQDSGYLEVLPKLIDRMAPGLSDDELRLLDEYLGSQAVESPAISRQSHCLARLKLSQYLQPERATPILKTVMDEIGQVSDFYLFHFEVYREIVALLPESSVPPAFEIALRYDVDRRMGALRALIPRLDRSQQRQAIDVLLSDILSLDGLDALDQMEAAFDILFVSPKHMKMMRHELINRLHEERNSDRARILSSLSSRHMFAEPFLSRDVLSQIARQLVELYDDWRWM